jgi:hypothetical protein
LFAPSPAFFGGRFGLLGGVGVDMSRSLGRSVQRVVAVRIFLDFSRNATGKSGT